MTQRGIGLLAVLLVAAMTHGGEPARNSDVSKPAFEQLVVTIKPFDQGQHEQSEELRIEATGRCWYKIGGREAKPNFPARQAAVFHYDLPAERIRRLNSLLEKTRWLNADGAEGQATHTHPDTVTLSLKRDGKVRKVICRGQRPEPYASLLHTLHGLVLQERRVYLWKYAGGKPGVEAWQDIGREIAGLRGDPYDQPVYDFDYSRYLAIAHDVVHDFYSRDDDELVPAIRLIGHLKAEAERNVLHRMAHDRSSDVRREVAWALGRTHHRDSLPVLASMMSAPANNEAAGLQLVTWGDDAVPVIVDLIKQSTSEQLDHRANLAGEDMIRAYLEHWDQLDRPIDPRVTTAVKNSLASANPMNGLIRTTYHKEFLQKALDAPSE